MIYSVVVSPRAGMDAGRLDQRLMERSPAAAARFGDRLEQAIADSALPRRVVLSSEARIPRIWHGLEDRTP